MGQAEAVVRGRGVGQLDEVEAADLEGPEGPEEPEAPESLALAGVGLPSPEDLESGDPDDLESDDLLSDDEDSEVSVEEAAARLSVR